MNSHLAACKATALPIELRPHYLLRHLEIWPPVRHAAKKINVNISMAIAPGIQIGANTHHHDHAMYPVSLSAMNKIAKRPKKLTDTLLFPVSLEAIYYSRLILLAR